MKQTAEALRYLVRLALEDGISRHEISQTVWCEFQAEDKRQKRRRG